MNDDGIDDYGNLGAPPQSNLAVRPRSPGGIRTFDKPSLWDDAGLVHPIFNTIPNGIEFLLESVRFQVASLGSTLSIDPSIPYWASDSYLPGAIWWQDSNLQDEPEAFNGTNNKTYFAGSSVTFFAGPLLVPEPGSAVLALVAASVVAIFGLATKRFTARAHPARN